MESLAYLYGAAAYESNEPMPQIRSFDTLGSAVPSSAWISIQPLFAAVLAISVTHSALAAATGVVSTTGNPLNIRSAPNGDVVGSVPDGSRLQLTGRSQDGFLELSNGTWVATEWISTSGTDVRKSSSIPSASVSSIPTASASPTRPPSSRAERTVAYIATAGEGINVRTAPGGQVVGTLPNSTRVELTGRESQGYLERTNATWLDKRYVSANQPRVVQPAPVKAVSPSVPGQAIAPPTSIQAASSQPPRPTTPVKAVTQAAPQAAPQPVPQATAQAARPTATSQPASTQVATNRTAQTVGYVRTTGNPLNVRNAPGGQVISTLPNGSRVELTGRDNTGYLERSNGTWLDQRYVAYTPSSGNQAASPSPSPRPSPRPSQPVTAQPRPTATNLNPAPGTVTPGTVTSGSSNTSRSSATVRTSGDPLNVRSAPSGAIVTTVANGSRVDLTGRRSGEWVERTDRTWVSSAWLAVSPSPTPTQPQPNVGASRATATIRTNGSSLNVRSSAGGAVVGSVPNGSRIDLSGRRTGEWAERTDGTWIASVWLVPTAGTTPGTGSNPAATPGTPGNSGSNPPAVGSDVSAGTIRTNGSPLNVRNNPNGAVIGVIANGSRVELTGRNSSGWVQLGQGGWVASEWVVR